MILPKGYLQAPCTPFTLDRSSSPTPTTIHPSQTFLPFPPTQVNAVPLQASLVSTSTTSTTSTSASLIPTSGFPLTSSNAAAPITRRAPPRRTASLFGNLFLHFPPGTNKSPLSFCSAMAVEYWFLIFPLCFLIPSNPPGTFFWKLATTVFCATFSIWLVWG